MRNHQRGGRQYEHPIKAVGKAALCRVFSVVQRKDRPYRGDGSKRYDAGRLPGKPERNAVPRKGDTMGIPKGWTVLSEYALKKHPKIL